MARRRSFTTVLALALALASSSAAALGLGQILLKSKLGEPLLAEIPIVSSDPAELEQLTAGLASPETFARIGLQPPDRTVANLRFTPALNNAGDPVIRITSAQPIDAPLLTFLVEVDWGQGRLVREYSTLLDAPRTVAAPLQPSIEAPVAAPSNAIVRQPAIPRADDLAVEPSAVPELADNPTPRVAERPAPVSTAVPPPAASRVGEYGSVESGETLSQIARQLDLGASLDQAMIALLRANPDAFINDNINLLKQGAVLRVPERSEVASIDAAQASALVQGQLQQWREARTPVPQPIAASGAVGEAAAAVDAAGSVPATRGARLEIVPPGASRALQAGTQSGISAGGEGEMLRQELQQTKETLAARDAELAEMQSRLAELEKLQGDQQQLLSMKDNELAAAQQRLAESQQASPAAAADTGQSSSVPWVVGGLALLLLAALAVWWMRRKAPAVATFRAPVPRSSPLADAFAPGSSALPESRPTATMSPGSDADEPERVPDSEPERAGPLPLWDRSARAPASDDLLTGSAQAATPAPAWHDTASKPKLAMPAVVSDGAPATGVVVQQRLELARAYLDLGDHESARQLLGEVAADGDPADRQHATRMLRELE